MYLINTSGTKIMDLVNSTIKMSKSSDNSKVIIYLLDDVKEAEKKYIEVMKKVGFMR